MTPLVRNKPAHLKTEYLVGICCSIKMTSHKHHIVSNHWQFDCLFNILFRLTTMITPKLHITGHFLILRSGIPRWPFPWHDVTMKGNVTLQWRHNERDSVSYHQPHDCLLNRLFRRRSKKTSKLRVTGLCAGNSPGTVGQWRGKCFHLMTSSWNAFNSTLETRRYLARLRWPFKIMT